MIRQPAAWSVRFGRALLLVIALLTLFAPVLAPYPPEARFPDRTYAPPTPIRIVDAGGLRPPFIFPQVLVDRLRSLYEEDTSRRAPIAWFSEGRLATVTDGGPLLVLGADDIGRDVLSRLLHGARLSLGVTLAGVVGALVLGGLAGGVAGSFGGRTDTVLMTATDFVIVLPGAYLVVVLRGLLPAELDVRTVFIAMAALLAVAGTPHVARGVRAIVGAERRREYAEAVLAAGAGPWRLAGRLLPAASGFLAAQGVLLVPAMLIAEVTVSFAGLGFPSGSVSWGTMLHGASDVSMMRRAPWMLTPAAALFLVVLGVQLATGRAGRTGALSISSGPPIRPGGPSGAPAAAAGLSLTPSRARR